MSPILCQLIALKPHEQFAFQTLDSNLSISHEIDDGKNVKCTSVDISLQQIKDANVGDENYIAAQMSNCAFKNRTK